MVHQDAYAGRRAGAPRPFSSWGKYRKLIAESEAAPGYTEGHCTIGNDGIYESEFDRRMRLYSEGKRQWVADAPFKAAIGPASTGLEKVDRIMFDGPYYPPVNHKFRPDGVKAKFMDPKRGFRLS